MEIWQILDLEPTNDLKEIKKAYARQLKKIDPKDMSAIISLRNAYECAIEIAKNSYLWQEQTVFDVDDESNNPTDTLDIQQIDGQPDESDETTADLFMTETISFEINNSSTQMQVELDNEEEINRITDDLLAHMEYRNTIEELGNFADEENTDNTPDSASKSKFSYYRSILIYSIVFSVLIYMVGPWLRSSNTYKPSSSNLFRRIEGPLPSDFDFSSKWPKKIKVPQDMLNYDNITFEVLTKIFDKPAESITWDDIARVQYLSFYEGSLYYALDTVPTEQTPESGNIVQGMNIETREIGSFIGIFSNLKSLWTDTEIGALDPELFDPSVPYGLDIEQLHITDNIALDVFFNNHNFKNIKQMTLPKITPFTLEVIAKQSQLESLSFTDMHITDLTRLENCKQLKTLIIFCPNVSYLPDFSVFSVLTSLSLKGKAFDLETIIRQAPNLRHLSAYVDNLEPLVNLPNLESLNIGIVGNKTNKISLTPLTQLSHLESLTITMLGSNSSFSHSEQLSSLQQLKVFNLYTETYSTNWFMDLSFMQTWTNLEEFRVSDATVYAKTWPLDNKPNLKILHLKTVTFYESYKVDGDGYYYYTMAPWTDNWETKLVSLITLEELYLDYNHLTNISFVEPLINLKRISLKGNNIQDNSPLDGLKNLEKKDL